MKYVYCLIISFVLIFLSGCRGQKAVEHLADDAAYRHDTSAVGVYGADRVSAMPKAVIYKTNGDYDDHVFINLKDGKVVYYPAPTDVSADSAPLSLGDGWLLDRRGGISTASAFTSYTYSEYSALPQAPSPAQLKASVIAGARVTEVCQLPITPQQAAADPELAKSYIPHK